MRLFPFLERRPKADPASRPARRRPANGSANGHAARTKEPDVAHGRQGWLTVANVQKSYRSRMVVKGVSLATGRGEAVGHGPRRRRG